MHILHLSISDAGSGSVLSACRLQKELLGLGADPLMFVAHSHSDANDPSVNVFHPPRLFSVASAIEFVTR
jgi:hypothetical protein